MSQLEALRAFAQIAEYRSIDTAAGIAKSAINNKPRLLKERTHTDASQED